jgi:hypothetical protein
MTTVQPLNPQFRIIDTKTGYLTREGFQFLQGLRETIAGGEFQAADETLDNLSGLGSTLGIVVQTAVDTFTKREIMVGQGLDLAHGAGTDGNPTISLDDDLVTLASSFSVGTWSPTLTVVSNLDAVTLTGVGNYLRLGARVVAGFVASVDPTAGGGAATEFSFTLPIGGDVFASAQDCLGSATFAVAQRAGSITASAATNLGLATFASEGTAAIAVVCSFMYILL